MPQVRLATHIDARIKAAVDKLCEARGLALGRFVEEALVDKLEELEDLQNLPAIRHEQTRPLTALLKDLGLDGKL